MVHRLDDGAQILWNAFVAQVTKPPDRQPLLDREKAKYQIAVPDADFFARSQ
jgi:hypothetical protein